MGKKIFILISLIVLTLALSGCTTLQQLTGFAVAGNDYGNNYCTIIGGKFDDQNGDGVLNIPEEPSVPGVTIKLYSGDTEIDTTVTNEGGLYEFTDLEPGTYTVCEVLPDGKMHTVPSSGCYEDFECLAGDRIARSFLNTDDSDGDGVCDNNDACPGTTPWYAPAGLNPNHHDSSNMDLTLTFGCSGEQIADCHPGSTTFDHGIPPGIYDVFTSLDGWAEDVDPLDGLPDCNYGEEEKDPLENTDSDMDGIVDALDDDNDGDGIPDVEDTEPDSRATETGTTGTGKPDWWCDKHPGKC